MNGNLTRISRGRSNPVADLSEEASRRSTNVNTEKPTEEKEPVSEDAGLFSPRNPLVQNIRIAVEQKLFQKKDSWATAQYKPNYHTSGPWYIEPNAAADRLVFHGKLLRNVGSGVSGEKVESDIMEKHELVICRPAKFSNMCYLFACIDGSFKEKDRIFINVNSFWDLEKINPIIAEWKLVEKAADVFEWAGSFPLPEWVNLYIQAVEAGKVTDFGRVDTESQQQAINELQECIEMTDMVVDEQPEPNPVVENQENQGVVQQPTVIVDDDEPFGNPKEFPVVGAKKKPTIVEIKVNLIETVPSETRLG